MQDATATCMRAHAFPRQWPLMHALTSGHQLGGHEAEHEDKAEGIHLVATHPLQLRRQD